MKRFVRLSLAVTLGLFGLNGCEKGSDGDTSEEKDEKSGEKGSKDGEKGEGKDGESGEKETERVGKVGDRVFKVKRMDGVDVFFSTKDGRNKDKALHSGEARIVDDCLFVGDALVIWPKDGDMAKEALKKAKKGSEDKIELGGGGTSVKEDGATLDVDGLDIKCSVDEVWFASAEKKKD